MIEVSGRRCLPTGERSPLLRLEQSKHRMDAIKHTPEAVLSFGPAEPRLSRRCGSARREQDVGDGAARGLWRHCPGWVAEAEDQLWPAVQAQLVA